jgi:signal transduction histidine kinase
MTWPLPRGWAGVPRSWRRLPRRTIRLRLTLVYAGLFLLSGAVLLTITYLVVDNHTPTLLEQRVAAGKGAGGPSAGPGSAVQMPGSAVQLPGFGVFVPPPAGSAPDGAASGNASGGAGPVGSASASGGTEFCVRSGSFSSATPSQYGQCLTYYRAQAAAIGSDYLRTLLVASGIALGVMTVAALGLGWLVSGRVLSPLRTITLTARNISASNLHERLALGGPDDELKELGDTVDGLLARLEGSFAAQRQFVANASHELRTPLARQRTLMEVALADPERSLATLEAACGRVLAAGQQQERMIEALLTLARSQRGLDHREPVDLAGVTSEAVLARTAEADRLGIRMTTELGPAALAGDARLTERLVANLLDNAIRHNVAGGRVLVTTMTANGQAVLSVANTGPAIDPGDMAGLFEPFRRGGVQRTGVGVSPGLGLSIVDAIAAAHGAELQAVARPEGGLAVEVRYPAQPDLAGQDTGLVSLTR